MQGGDPAVGRKLAQALLLNFVNDTLPQDPSGSVVMDLAGIWFSVIASSVATQNRSINMIC